MSKWEKFTSNRLKGVFGRIIWFLEKQCYDLAMTPRISYQSIVLHQTVPRQQSVNRTSLGASVLTNYCCDDINEDHIILLLSLLFAQWIWAVHTFSFFLSQRKKVWGGGLRWGCWKVIAPTKNNRGNDLEPWNLLVIAYIQSEVQNTRYIVPQISLILPKLDIRSLTLFCCCYYLRIFRKYPSFHTFFKAGKQEIDGTRPGD